MTGATNDKAAVLARLDEAERAWREIAAAAQTRHPDRPGAAGDNWTFTDVAGHLNGWRIRSVDRLEAAARGAEPPRVPWPAHLREESDDDVDAINAWFHERYRGRPLPELLAEADDQFGRMRAAVALVSEADLLTPGRYPWLTGYALADVIGGSCEHLREEHEPALRAWLAAV